MGVNHPDPERPNAGKPTEIQLLAGFPATSRFIASDPAKTTVIFRRFDELAVRNLLHLEARLVALENLQKEYDKVDYDFQRRNEPITTIARSWEDFAVLATELKDTSNGDQALPASTLQRWRQQRLEKVAEETNQAKEAIKHDSLESIVQAAKAEYQRSSSLRSLATAAAHAPNNPPTVGVPAMVAEPAPLEPEAVLNHPIKAEDVENDRNLKAFRESQTLYANALGCGPASLALIRARWDLAQAIDVTLKEYRMLSKIPNLLKSVMLIDSRGSCIPISKDAEA